jgi:hypothetical protein
MDDGEILADYPTLTEADLDAARLYARLNSKEIENALEENMDDVIRPATGYKRFKFPMWLLLLLAFAGSGLLIILGGMAVLLVYWPSRLAAPPTSFTRPGFTFEYLGSWTVDDKDKDYDLDHLFTIDASQGAMVMFVIADAELDATTTLATHVQAQSKRIPNAMQSKYHRWGRYTGQGAVLRGRALGLIRVTFRVFVFNAEGRTFTIIEYCPDDEKQSLAPGFQMIENTFQVLSVEEGPKGERDAGN